VEVTPPRVLGEKASASSQADDYVGSTRRCGEPLERRLESLLPDLGSIRDVALLLRTRDAVEAVLTRGTQPVGPLLVCLGEHLVATAEPY
jgi:hypothetical protein